MTGSVLQDYIKEYNIEGGGLPTYTPTRWISVFEITNAIIRLKRPLEKV